MEAVIKADPIEARMRKAQKEGKLPQRTLARAPRSRRSNQVDHHAARIRAPGRTPTACATTSSRWMTSSTTSSARRHQEESWQAQENGRRVYVVDGARTPFLKAQKEARPFHRVATSR